MNEDSNLHSIHESRSFINDVLDSWIIIWFMNLSILFMNEYIHSSDASNTSYLDKEQSLKWKNNGSKK